MKNLSVARRYAKAIYELAQESKSMDEVVTGLTNILHATRDSVDLKKILKNPLITPTEKEALIKTITSNKVVLKFIALLSKRKRMDLFELVCDEIQTFVDIDKRIHRMLVKTATPLSETDKRDVEKTIAQSLGGTALGQFQVAKELIGGVWIKLGDKVLDATIKGRFDSMRHMLIHSTN